MTTAQTVMTPTARRVVRRSLFWVGGAVFAIVIAIIALGLAGSAAGGPPLDPTNPAPAGSMAVAEVLKQQGVDVVATSSLDDTRDAIDDPASTTLFIYDYGFYLDDAQLREAVRLADNVILADPGFAALRAVSPGVAQAGFVDEELESDCELTAVQKAGTVSGAGSGFRVVDDEADAIACLGSGDDVYSLVRVDGLTILGATSALSNEFVINDGNAALALNLFGGHDTLVWYLPSFADLPETGPETLGELTPAWVTPVLSLLVITFIVAAIWRGRRLGPLVIENLPVTVRASETMLGRARLYEKSSSRLRALDALRIGSIQRLAVQCGLPRLATVDDVIASVASATGAQPGDIRRLLIDAEPANDRDLIALSDALLVLERDVATAVRP
jgi:hypothetical protein